MDHLPVPRQVHEPYPRIPCLCARRDDATKEIKLLSLAELVPALDREEIPGLQEAFARGLATEASLDVLGPFLQSWLWFGTLVKIFSTVGVAVLLTDFIQDDDIYGLRLDTTLLHQHLWYWVATEAGASTSTQIKHDKQIQEHLLIVYSSLGNYRIHEVVNTPEWETSRVMQDAITDASNNVLLSISVLAECLDYARYLIYQTEPQRWWIPIQLTAWLTTSGWPKLEADCRPLQRTVTVSALLHITRIDRRPRLRTVTYPLSLDPATYRPVHIDQSCQCADVALSSTQKLEMETILRKGNYPVNTYGDTESSTRWLHVRESHLGDNTATYVAMSHVWSDGLGNLQGNALPAC